MEKTEKLQKILARAGLGSRRELEEWITDGRISIDGKKATLGDRVTGRERIRVDGKQLRLKDSIEAKTTVIIYNKPEGQICTKNDPDGRETVFTTLPRLQNGRWIIVGRLDVTTQGLLLFTNNGELAHRLMHPSYEVEREYAVRVKGQVDKAMISRLQQGVELHDGMAKFETITDEGGEGLNHWYKVVLKEGRNRIVRRLWESQDVMVSRLIRVSYADITLPRNLPRGRWEYMDKEVAKQLQIKVKMDV